MPPNLSRTLQGLALGCLIQTTQAQSITAFTTTQLPLQNVPPETTIIHLDQPQLIEAQMSLDLPGNPQEAARLIRSRMQSLEWKQLGQDLQQSSEGVARARVLGVVKLPAVTVDDRYVVYGIADVAQALEAIRTGGRDHAAE